MKAPFDIAGDLDTPVSAYMKLAAFKPCFLLESVEGGERLARYSFVGFGDSLEVKLDASGLQVGSRLHARPGNAGELLNQLRAALAAAPRPEPEISGVPLAGGLVGFASYDVVRFFEHLPKRVATADGVPALHYVAPRSLLVFDHLTRSIALLHAGSASERAALRREIIQALRGGLPTTPRPGRYQQPIPSMTRDEYIAGVKRIQEYIAAGDVYQLVLAARFSGRHELDPFQAYRALRLINPSPYMYYCALGNITVVGSSPEALVKLTGGKAQLRPIAGTRPRSDDAAIDVARESELKADPKENAEHVMLVDLARNDLGRVAAAGSVHVDPYRHIERYSHVMHIVSHVVGEIAENKTGFDALRATFPAGTVSGAPKVRAMQIISELEKSRRGFYSGVVGYFGIDGSIDTCIALRSIVLIDGRAYLQTGAGIVADSDPAREYEECVNKSKAMLEAIERARTITQ
jgi:anthranilate synthase component I